MSSLFWALSLAELLLRFALLARHLLAAAVLQLFALVVVRSHFQQPAAVYLNHLWGEEALNHFPGTLPPYYAEALLWMTSLLTGLLVKTSN